MRTFFIIYCYKYINKNKLVFVKIFYKLFLLSHFNMFFFFFCLHVHLLKILNLTPFKLRKNLSI